MTDNFEESRTKDILLVTGKMDSELHAFTIIGYGSEVKQNVRGREEKRNYYICQNSYGDE